MDSRFEVVMSSDAPKAHAANPGSHSDARLQSARFLAAMAEARIEDMIPNVSVPIFAVAEGEHVFPCTRSRPTAGSRPSYVVSPRTAYIDYAREEMHKVGDALVEAALSAFVTAAERALDAGRLDDVVYVNNWLLSTNLYPERVDDGAGETLRRLGARHCASALAYRSLNRRCNGERMDRLRLLGFEFLPSRQVYLFDARDSAGRARIMQRSNTRADIRLLKKRSKEDPNIVPHESLRAADFAQIERLYSMLYLDKYSRLNPQYTARFLEAAHRHGWIRFTALRHPAGHLEAVLGTYALGDTITAPIVGYDTGAPPSRALYRRLMALVIRQALDEHLMLNLSSGAAGFKRLRGGEPEIEYTAVFTQHLRAPQRWAWGALCGVIDRIGRPLLERYEL